MEFNETIISLIGLVDVVLNGKLLMDYMQFKNWMEGFAAALKDSVTDEQFKTLIDKIENLKPPQRYVDGKPVTEDEYQRECQKVREFRNALKYGCL